MASLIYITPYNLERSQTNQNADMKFCEGLALNGMDVTLLYPYEFRSSYEVIKREKIFSSYGIAPVFSLKKIAMPFRYGFPQKYKFLFMSLYLLYTSFIINIRSKPTFVVSRNIDLLIPFIIMDQLFSTNQTIIHWAHELLDSRRARWAYKKCNALIATNSAIVEDAADNYRIKKNRMEISFNPISQSHLESPISKQDARETIGYTLNKPLCVYTGKIYKSQREINYILAAAQELADYHFIITGGKPDVVDIFEKHCYDLNIHNVSFTGFILDYADIRAYQYAADVLISYYSPQDHNVRHNLPNKICEYMATSNPILTPDYPATRDILNEQNCIFVEPENPEALAQAIRDIFNDYPSAKAKAAQAFLDVQELTYNKIGAKILVLLKNL